MENKVEKKRFRKVVLFAVVPHFVVGTSLLAVSSCFCTDGGLKNDGSRRLGSFLSSMEAPLECHYSDAPDPAPYTDFGAQTAHYFEQPSFVIDYFANLTEHYPTNNSGNCGYTAAAMLLSYYDVYWNRYVIPDQFNDLTPSFVLSEDDDVFSSPGVNDYYVPVWTKENPEMRQPDPKKDSVEYIRLFEENKREAYIIYLDYMLAYANDNLVSKLYQIALNPAVNAYDFEKEPAPAITPAGLKTVLNNYFTIYNLGNLIQLKTVNFLDFDNGVRDDYEMRKELRCAAIQRLQNGQPLIFFGKLSSEKYGDGVDGGGNQNGTGGHAVVAYGYSDDYIIGHMGWKSKGEYTCAILDKEFERFDAFAYLEVSPDLEFTPGNNRFYDHGFVGAADLCSHVHGNYVVINYEDDFYHALQCVCGDTYYMPHENVLGLYDERYHRYQCAVCGHERFAEHRFFQIYGVGWRCSVCGAVVEELPPGFTPWTHLYD